MKRRNGIWAQRWIRNIFILVLSFYISVLRFSSRKNQPESFPLFFVSRFSMSHRGSSSSGGLELSSPLAERKSRRTTRSKDNIEGSGDKKTPSRSHAAHKAAPTEVWSWGNGISLESPLRLLRGQRVIQVSAGGFHCAFLTHAGQLWVMGINSYVLISYLVCSFQQQFLIFFSFLFCSVLFFFLQKFWTAWTC